MRLLKILPQNLAFRLSGLLLMLIIYAPLSMATSLFSGGDGTAGSPYQITTPQQMNEVRNYMGLNFILMNDLDLTVAYPNWVPLGQGGTNFTGSFNGNGHTLKYQITSSASNYVGLFANNSGTISNLNLEANISASVNLIGGLVGNNEGTINYCNAVVSISGKSTLGAISGNNNGDISHCHVSGTVSSNNMSIGGLIGNHQNGNIDNCSATVNVSGSLYVGGLIGVFFDGTVTNCQSSANASSSEVAGGLIGSFIDGNMENCSSRGIVSTNNIGGGLAGLSGECTIKNCYSNADVVVLDKQAGGLIGRSAGIISYCYSTGSVSGASNVGGLIGDNYNMLSYCYSTSPVSGNIYLGGLVGTNDVRGMIRNCYSTGQVTGNHSIGGIVGQNFSDCAIDSVYSAGKITGKEYTGGLAGTNLGTLTRGYYNTITSNQSVGISFGSGDVTGLNMDDFTKAASFAGLDFSKIWQINEGYTYPVLRNINNAPFTFDDYVFSEDTVHLTSLLTNDFDYESGQSGLVFKVLPVLGSNMVSKGNYIFPSGSLAGFKDTLLYRAGEVVSAGDTLWGNIAMAILEEIPGLKAFPGTIQFRAANSSSSVYIHSNISWTAVSSAPWLTLDVLSGTGKRSVAIMAAENATGADRNATITISATDMPDVVIQVKQVAKIPLTVSITAQNKNYDGTADAPVNISGIAGKLPDDLVTVSVTGHFANKDAGTGKIVTTEITLSGQDAANYAFNTPVATASINKIPLTIVVTAKDKIYDGNTTAQANTSITNGLINGDDVSIVATGNFADKNIGYSNATFNISLAGADGGNYTTVATAEDQAFISAARLNIRLNVMDKKYDGTTNATGTATITGGLVTGEDVGVTVNSCSFTTKSAGDIVEANGTISINGADKNNYVFNSYLNATAKISRIPLTIAITGENKTYNGKLNATVKASITSGLMPGDKVSVDALGLFEDKNVGTGKTVNADIFLSGDDMNNYYCASTITTTAGITKKLLAAFVSSSSNSSLFKGGEPVTFTATYQEAINEEGVPSISLKGDGVNIVAPMTSTDRIKWNYQWTPPLTGSGTVAIGVALQDTARNFNQITDGVTTVMYENIPPITGVDNIPVKSFSLYPNPVTDGFFVTVGENSIQSEIIICTILDMNGKTMMQKNTSSSKYIPAGNLPAGAYTIIIRTPEKTVRMKLVKQ